MPKTKIEALKQACLQSLLQDDYDIILWFYIAKRCDGRNDFIPWQDIKYYIRHFKEKVKNYSNRVYIDEGGLFTSYQISNELKPATEEALKMNTVVELKTDAAWACDHRKAKAMWGMLDSLVVPREQKYSQGYIDRNIAAGFEFAFALGQSQETMVKNLKECFEPEGCFWNPPLFTLSISIADSAYLQRDMNCFTGIASRIAESKELSDKINLKVVINHKNFDYFKTEVLGSPKLKYPDISEKGHRFKFKLKGYPINGIISDFKNTSAKVAPKKDAPQEDEKARIPFFIEVNPGNKIAVGQSLIQIPYKTENNKYKNWSTIREDIALEYARRYYRENFNPFYNWR
ncbi:MAG: hypothetical protein FWE50_02910 [Alphaproteobacteria bacterium]|nr:hypothetical protein [Alphaproteobacteria bacterium]